MLYYDMIGSHFPNCVTVASKSRVQFYKFKPTFTNQSFWTKLCTSGMYGYSEVCMLMFLEQLVYDFKVGILTPPMFVAIDFLNRMSKIFFGIMRKPHFIIVMIIVLMD